MTAPLTARTLPYETVFERLEAGTLAVLPSARAARWLRQVYDADQRARGVRAWQAPRVLSWSSWTASLWSEPVVAGAESRLLLNAAQEQTLWSELIAELSPEGTLEQNLSSLAKLAQSGFALAAAWECLPRLRTTAATHDQRTFALWVEAFGQRCAEEGCVSSSLVESLLRQHLEKTQNPALDVPSTLLLVNWAEFTPAQHRWLDGLAKAGTQIEACAIASRPYSSGRRSAAHMLAIASDEREELFCAARWIRMEVQQAAKDKTHPAPVRIGVLLPGGPIPELEAVFREVLSPELQSIAADPSVTPWEFSRNEPLATVPLIAATLDLARLCVHALSLHAVSVLLLSPYLGGGEESEPNARFDAHVLRRTVRLRPEITLRSLASLVSAAARNSSGLPPAHWLPQLSEFAGKALAPKLRRSYSEWTEVLRRLVGIAGWPGPRTLSARELAAHHAWESTLDLIATLDFSGRRVPFVTALQAVERQLREATLDTPSAGAPVTVLSVSEAAGCAFDAVVLLRGTEEQWPPSRRPHSLLSIGLQKELGMPGTDPRWDRRPFESLLLASRTALATCAEANAEGSLRPAPLFRELGFGEIAAARLLPTRPASLPILEERVPDDAPLPMLPSTQVRGGARVLQLQAACGFLAFAAVRLGSTELEAREAGFDPRESGNLLHRTLEHFWKRVGSQTALRAMTFEQRGDLLTECIEQAVSARLQLETAWDQAFLALQKQRLRRLLNQWMDNELRRTPFTVAALEQEEHIQVGPLDLRVRIDRMDRLEISPESPPGSDSTGAGFVLVDYKSGYAADPKAWLGERPDQPQLPLYALLHAPEEVKGVAFAHIRSGKMKYAGLERVPGLLGTPRASAAAGTDLTAQMEQWSSALHALAEEFSQGVSEVRPKDVASTCKFCAQRLLCRLDPAALDIRDETDDEVNEPSGAEAYG